MAAYSLQFGKTDTLASQMAAGATTGTLSSGGFTNFTGDYLVLDYNNPSKREVIFCNVTGTAIASATRGQSGTSDVVHSAGAAVGYSFVPAHYSALSNGTGFATGTASVGIPAAAVKQEAWTSWVPTLVNMTLGNGTVIAKYHRTGNRVYYYFKFTLGSTSAVSAAPAFAPPITPSSTNYGFSPAPRIGGFVHMEDTGSNSYVGLSIIGTESFEILTLSTLATYLQNLQTTATVPFTWTTGDFMVTQGFYEAA
ncbi:MAG: hypothetical protein H0U60_20120 [Blastocatellia bacterium]|nr:hypothetical protein [Blastocatellia bacterium]